ncbi:MAG: O-antigen ligase family protein [Candidatus Eremiobacteraeota bacterium]|nr:O-antigen ligase family protein [Candidatus Eremiobacteraeota bacterium]
MPAALGLVYALLPLFPSFIALTAVAFPGISLIGRTPALAILAVCGILALYAVAMLARYPRRGSQPLLLPLLAVFGAGVLAGSLGFDPRAGLLFTLIGGVGIVWHCAILRFYDDPNAAETLLAAYLISATAAAAAAIAMLLARVPTQQYALQHGRATGTFILPGELAGYLIVALPIAFAVTRVSSARWLRVVGWCALVSGLPALFLTYSRAGWMGFVASVAFLVALRTRLGLRAAAAVVVAGVAAVLVLFNAHHDPSEDYTRVSIWQAAVQIIDRFPLTGVGPFNFSRLYTAVRAPDADATAFHAHSLYLTFFAEFGLAGVASVGWMIWRFAAELRRRLAATTPEGAVLASAVTAGLVGVAVQGLIDTVSVVIFGLMMPTLALALASAQPRDRPAPER